MIGISISILLVFLLNEKEDNALDTVYVIQISSPDKNLYEFKPNSFGISNVYIYLD